MCEGFLFIQPGPGEEPFTGLNFEPLVIRANTGLYHTQPVNLGLTGHTCDADTGQKSVLSQVRISLIAEGSSRAVLSVPGCHPLSGSE